MQLPLIAALLLGSPAQDDALCDALRQVVSAAPDDFQKVRGALVEHTDDSWQQMKRDPGSRPDDAVFRVAGDLVR